MAPPFLNPILRDASRVLREHAPLEFCMRVERGFREIERDLADLAEVKAPVVEQTPAPAGKAKGRAA